MEIFRRIAVTLLASLAVFGFGCVTEDDDNQNDSFEEMNFEVELAGENQVPAIATPASGTMEVTLDEHNVLTIEGTFDGLVSRLREVDGSSAHIHVGSEGENGAIIFNVNVDADSDERSGSFTLTETLSPDQVRLFENHEYYFNLHTTAYPEGELRAQLDPEAPDFADIDESWGVELTPEAQPIEVDSDGEGWVWAILRDDDTFVISGAASNLGSGLTEIQLEAGEATERGTIIATLNSEERDDGGYRFWDQIELDEDEIDELKDGLYFVNIYTLDEPQGELRGQLDEGNNFFQNLWEDIFGDDPAQIDTAPPF